MDTSRTDESLAVAATHAVRIGDLGALRQLLAEHPALATSWLSDAPGTARTLLHIVADRPGPVPNGAATVAMLVAAGADVHARSRGPHQETPLHRAASAGDLAVLDALLDTGADIDAPGAALTDGTPLSDATACAQWNTAFRLVERGASTTLVIAATLGLLDRVRAYFVWPSTPTQAEINAAYYGAHHSDHRSAADFLASHGADTSRIARGSAESTVDSEESVVHRT